MVWPREPVISLVVCRIVGSPVSERGAASAPKPAVTPSVGEKVCFRPAVRRPRGWAPHWFFQGMPSDLRAGVGVGGEAMFGKPEGGEGRAGLDNTRASKPSLGHVCQSFLSVSVFCGVVGGVANPAISKAGVEPSGAVSVELEC